MNITGEVAKAVAEASKFGTKSIEATEKMLGFLSKVFNESIEQAAGIVSDRLMFIRFERLVRIEKQVEQILGELNIEKTRPILPKFALPMLENASLEEDDELQDIWIKLMANAMDPHFDASFRMAYIEIIKGLTSLDVKILDLVYHKIVKNGTKVRELMVKSCYSRDICNDLKLSEEDYLDSIYNLFRVQCLTPTILSSRATFAGEPFSTYKGDSEVSITPLGKNFVEACIKKD